MSDEEKAKAEAEELGFFDPLLAARKSEAWEPPASAGGVQAAPEASASRERAEAPAGEHQQWQEGDSILPPAAGAPGAAPATDEGVGAAPGEAEAEDADAPPSIPVEQLATPEAPPDPRVVLAMQHCVTRSAARAVERYPDDQWEPEANSLSRQVGAPR